MCTIEISSFVKISKDSCHALDDVGYTYIAAIYIKLGHV